jgi:methionyl aminopeptidase
MTILNREQITDMRKGGQILAAILRDLMTIAKPGVQTKLLSKRATVLLEENNVEPSFLGYKGYPDVICLAVNDQAVHTPGSDYALREGDLLKLDFGVVLNGLHTDSARTMIVSALPELAQKVKYRAVRKLIQATKEGLDAGIKQCVPGNSVGDISAAVQARVEKDGFTILKQLGGHGIGHILHDEPFIPNFGKAGSGPRLQSGMVIAIEPITTMGKNEISDGDDGFSYETADGALAAHFEHTVAITDEGPEVLTM